MRLLSVSADIHHPLNTLPASILIRLREPMPNMLGHSPLSAQFATNPLHLKTALFHTEVAAPIALRMTEMTCQYNASEKHNETAHNIALGSDLPFFPYLSQNPTIAARLQAGHYSVSSRTDGRDICNHWLCQPW